MNQNSKKKNIVWGIFRIVLIVVAVIWFLGDDLEHIEDTNGADNYALQEITDENLITNRWEITVDFAAVEEGNFRMVLVVDDEIVHEFALNELTQTYVLEDVSGYVALRIAGESANFTFDYYIN